MLNETQRQEAMQTLGLPVLVSRFILPGAKPSCLIDQGQADAPVPTEALLESEKLEKTEKPVEKTDIAVNVDISENLESAEQAIQSVAGLFETHSNLSGSENLESADALRYVHCIFQLGQTLYIVDPLDEGESRSSCLDLTEHSTQDAKHIQRFLSDVEQFAFGERKPVIFHQPFEWPHPKLQKNITEDDMAYPMEQAYLTELYKAQAFERVVIFSQGQTKGLIQDSQPAVLEVDNNAYQNSCLDYYESSVLDKSALLAPSVQQFWSRPENKLTLLQQLKQFFGS